MAGFSKREAVRAASETTWTLAQAIIDLQEAVRELLAVDIDTVGWEDWERIRLEVEWAEARIANALEEVGALKRQLEQLREIMNERELAKMRVEIMAGTVEEG